jgi:hypothetical protein
LTQSARAAASVARGGAESGNVVRSAMTDDRAVCSMIPKNGYRFSDKIMRRELRREGAR